MTYNIFSSELFYVGVAFIFFVAFVFPIAKKGITAFLDKQIEEVTAKLSEAESILEEAESQLKEVEAIKARTSEEAKKIIESAKEKAKFLLSDFCEQAEDVKQKRIALFENRLLDQRRLLIEQFKDDLVEAVISDINSKIKIGAKDQSEMVKASYKHFDKLKKIH